MEGGIKIHDLPQQAMDALRRIFPSLDWQLRDENEEAEQAILKFAQVYLELKSQKENLTPDEFEAECRMNIDLEELLLVAPILLDSKSLTSREVYALRNRLRKFRASFKKRLTTDTSFEDISNSIRLSFEYGLTQPCLAKMLETGRGNCQAFSQISLMVLRELDLNYRLFLEVIVPEDGVGVSHQRVILKDPNQEVYYTFDPVWSEVKALDYVPQLQDPPEYVLLEAFILGQNWPIDVEEEWTGVENKKIKFKSNFAISRGLTRSSDCPTEEEILARMPAQQRVEKKQGFRFTPKLRFPLSVEQARFAIAALCLATVVDTTIGLLPEGPEPMTTVLVEPESREVTLLTEELSEEVQEVMSGTEAGIPTVAPTRNDEEVDRIVKSAAMMLIKETFEERAKKEREEAKALPLLLREIKLVYVDLETKGNKELIAEIESQIDEVSTERLMGFWTEQHKITKEPSRESFFGIVKILWSLILAGLLLGAVRAHKRDNTLSGLE